VLTRVALDEEIREGRFQRGLALVTAFSGVLAGLEVTYEHYRGSYRQKIMYVPVLVSPVLTAAGLAAFMSARASTTVLRTASIATLATGAVGFILHIRKPGGWRLPVVNYQGNNSSTDPDPGKQTLPIKWRNSLSSNRLPSRCKWIPGT